MIQITISIITFASVLILSVALLFVISNVLESAPKLDQPDNVFTNSIIGKPIRYFSHLNENSSRKEKSGVLEHQLLQAGKPWGNVTGANYLAFAQVSAILSFFVFGGCVLLFGGSIASMIVVGLLVAVLAYWLIIESVKNKTSERRREISRQFPHFMDLAVMTMEAGSSFLETVKIYSNDNKNTALSEEFSVLLSELNMGSTVQESLHNMSKRIPSEFVQRTIANIVQGQEMGTPIGKILRDLSDSMRFHRTQAAERAAEELKVKIMGPIVLMMISIFLLILGPAVIEVLSSNVL